MKKLFAAALVLSAFAAPAQASPTWATATAKSACKYMVSGASYDKSMLAAFDANDHWSSEMHRAYERGVFGIQLMAAIKEQCPTIFMHAYREQAQQEAQVNAYKNSPKAKAITRVGNLIMESQSLMAKGDLKQACVKANEADRLQKAYSLGTSRPLQYALTSCVQV